MDYQLGARYHKEERNWLTEKKETDRKKVEGNKEFCCSGYKYHSKKYNSDNWHFSNRESNI